MFRRGDIAVEANDLGGMEDSTFNLSPSRFRYAEAKRKAEVCCMTMGSASVEIVCVQPAEVYGPDDIAKVTCGNLIDFALSCPVWVCHGGTSIVHVDDVANGIIAALDRGEAGQRYILGGENLTIRQLAALTLRLLERSQPIVSLPNGLIRGLAWLGRVLRVPLPFDPEVVPYATRYWFVDNAKARQALGLSFRAAVDTLRPTLAWCRQVGYLP